MLYDSYRKLFMSHTALLHLNTASCPIQHGKNHLIFHPNTIRCLCNVFDPMFLQALDYALRQRIRHSDKGLGTQIKDLAFR